MDDRRLYAVFAQLKRAITLALACSICLYGGAGVAFAAASQTKQAEKVVPRPTHAACADVAIGHARCLSDVSFDSYSNPEQAVQPGTSGGYGPAEFHTAYQLPCKPGGSVASVCSTPGSFGPETIAIVDAGGYNGSLESDLQTYDSHYGLPACTAANGCLTIVNQDGDTSPLPSQVSSGWRSEIALDVQTAHMVCQTCKIVLVEADDDYVDSLAAAENTAATFSPIAISNSFGADIDVTAYDNDFKHSGIAVVAATGDDGTLTGGQSWPADIPQVVAASGTTLQLNNDDTWASETVWSGSGGGCSVTYSAPSWQTSRGDWASHGCNNGGRAFGDISAAGNPSTGAAIVIGSSWYIIGGTSLSTPLIASMYALGNDLPSGNAAASLLYQKSSSSNTHDITSGNDCTSVGQPNCTAASGFDVPSGLGSPKGLAIFKSSTADAATYTSQLSAGTILNAGEALGSSTNNPAYRLIMQGDGNLVVYKHGKAIWNSHTAHTGSHNRLVLQNDGNLVLRTSSNKAVWNSGTEVRGMALKGTKLVMQTDGNLVLRTSSNQAIWNSRSGRINATVATRMNAGQSMYAYQALGSSLTKPRYRMIHQKDGNLVVYKGGRPIWSSHTAHTGSRDRLVLQGDGNLVLYKGHRALWNSHTAHTGSHNRLTMQGDGNLVLRTSSGHALWSTFTGRIH